MTSAKIPVPPGFVVLSTTFDKFIEETDVDVERLIEDAEPGETSRLKEQALRNGGQPELKKLQLKSEALGIQSDLFSLVDRLKRVVMDLEASKIE